MKKDRIIENKLNCFADNMNLDVDIIQDAIAELRERKLNKQIRRQRNTISWKQLLPIGYAAVVIFVIALSINIIGDLFIKNDSPSLTPSPPPPSTNNIVLSRLHPNQITYDEITDYSDINLIALNYEEMSVEYYVYKDNTNQDILLSSKSKIIVENGTDEVMVIIDLVGAFKYLDFKYAYLHNDHIIVKYDETLFNGEYYTIATLEINDNRYYLMIMSPNNYRILEYVDNIYNESVQND